MPLGASLGRSRPACPPSKPGADPDVRFVLTSPCRQRLPPPALQVWRRLFRSQGQGERSAQAWPEGYPDEVRRHCSHLCPSMRSSLTDSFRFPIADGWTPGREMLPLGAPASLLEGWETGNTISIRRGLEGRTSRARTRLCWALTATDACLFLSLCRPSSCFRVTSMIKANSATKSPSLSLTPLSYVPPSSSLDFVIVLKVNAYSRETSRPNSLTLAQSVMTSVRFRSEYRLDWKAQRKMMVSEVRARTSAEGRWS